MFFSSEDDAFLKWKARYHMLIDMLCHWSLILCVQIVYILDQVLLSTLSLTSSIYCTYQNKSLGA